MDSTTALRKQLLANGYTPIPNVGKMTFLKGWPTVEVNDAIIEQWGRKHKRWPDTGIRVENGLAVIDLDVDHDVLDAIADEMEAQEPDLLKALVRYGKGQKMAWFVRTSEPFTRLHTRRWLAPGENVEEHGTHVVEIFGGASPRQFGAFGAHTRDEKSGEVKVAYDWADTEGTIFGAGRNPLSPATVPLGDLPELSKEQFAALVDLAERVLEQQGFTPVQRTTKGESEAERVYDLAEDMLFEDNEGRDGVPLSAVRDRCGDQGYRVSASFIEPGRNHSRTRCLVGQSHSGALTIWDSATGVTHMEAKLAPVQAEERARKLEEVGRRIAEKLKEAEASESKQRRLTKLSTEDDLMTASNKLLNSYALCPTQQLQVVPIWADDITDGMTLTNFRHYVAPWSEPMVGKNGQELKTRMSPADVWVTSDRRLTVGGLRMRPDKPRPTYEEGGRTWVNVYAQPVHKAVPEGQEVFIEFMEHLHPDLVERDYFMDVLAHKLLHPSVPGPGILMVSQRQGAGRGTLFAMLRQLYGPKYTRKVDPVTLTGEGGQSQYNTWLASSVVVLIDELFNAGDGAVFWRRKKAYDRIKTLIDPSAREVEIIQKTLNNFTAPTYASFFMATNNANALPLDDDDRRICVLTNGGKLADNAGLSSRLNRFRAGGDFSEGFIAGIAAVLAERSLEGFDAFAPPPTFAGKVSMIHRNMTEVGEAADEVLAELPGDYVTRKAFVERVRMKVKEASVDGAMPKHLADEARDRIDRSGWVFMGRVKINEKENKADVWARDERAAKLWYGVSWSEREALIGVSSDPRRKASEAQIRAFSSKLTIIGGGKEK